MKSKQFSATTGKTDQNAIAEIQKFFNEPTFHNWLKYFNYVRTGTVHTGIPTKRFLDKNLFDKHIHIRHSKHVSVKRDDDSLFVLNVIRRDGKNFTEFMIILKP